MSLTTQQIFFQRYISPDDQIQAVFHRHFLVEVPNIFFWLTIPIIGVSYGIYYFFYPAIIETPYLYLFEGYLFVMFLVMIHKIMDWYSDVWIISNNGVYDIKWSIFMKDITFIDFGEISGVKASQKSIFDKVCNIGDITLYKNGDEIYVPRMYRSNEIVRKIEENLVPNSHQEEPKNDLNIFIDGVRQNHSRYTRQPRDSEDQYVESMRKKRGTIDLS